MFDSLLALQIETEDTAAPLLVKDATSTQVLNALYSSAGTDNPFAEFGAPSDEEIDIAMHSRDARAAFTTLITEPDDDKKKLALTTIKAPEAVQHLVASLTAYDWEFIEQAKGIRGKVVATLLNELEHPDARIRLKAAQLLGQVSEVSLFTTKVEVKTTVTHDSTEIDTRVAERLQRLLDSTVVVEVLEAPSGT
jgi:hypothetical protein